MIVLVEQLGAELAAICRQYSVARLELFGSAADGTFDPARSDVDFLVEFGDVPDDRRFDAYFGLLRALESLFERHVDLVEAGAPRNPFFIRRLNESRQVVYAAYKSRPEAVRRSKSYNAISA